MTEALNLCGKGLDIILNGRFIQPPPAGFHIEKQITPFSPRNPINPHIRKVHIAQNDFKSGMGKKGINIQPIFHVAEVFRYVQILLFTEITQGQPVCVVSVLEELIRPRTGEDINAVNLRFLRNPFILGDEILVDLLTQIVVAVIFPVNVYLNHHMILIQNILSFREGAGNDIPQTGGIGV